VSIPSYDGTHHGQCVDNAGAMNDDRTAVQRVHVHRCIDARCGRRKTADVEGDECSRGAVISVEQGTILRRRGGK
jgi:hypothetical protein